MRRKLRSLYLWHRWLGGLAALPVLALALSGLALNHTEGLGLDSSRVRSPWLLDWYGIRAPATARGFRAGRHRLVELGERLFMDGRPLPGAFPPLVGAEGWQGLVVVALEDGLLLVTAEGQLVERLGEAAGIPLPVQRLGHTPEGALVVAGAGRTLLADPELLHWETVAGLEVTWSREVATPPEALRRMQSDYRGQALSQERVLLDLHSGRLFGHWGPWVMDGAALLLLTLAGSGLTLWLRSTLRRRNRKRGR